MGWKIGANRVEREMKSTNQVEGKGEREREEGKNGQQNDRIGDKPHQTNEDQKNNESEGYWREWREGERRGGEREKGRKGERVETFGLLYPYYYLTYW